ncbi:MAG: ABC transporter ATP-binding protein/permease [Bacteroidetes bacterium]|uniref:ABC transporter ATP-binding protein n=1 Tax=Phnomibacter sp. TaxID=2836217 RepID=UPI002FDDC545|nr:ABC transporter ATP-binding protein/permease [Bacteroidota bacterium]
MKILWHYLRPYRGMVFISLLLAAVNQTFSLLDPLFFGKLFDEYIIKAESFRNAGKSAEFFKGVMGYLGILIGVAMVSRIAKAFQDYFSSVVIQKFGASIFTEGLRHSMRLPFQEFEDQRSGETLSILTKVRTDTEKFISLAINVVFGILVGIVFVSVFAFNKHWSIVPVYLVGVLLLSWLTSALSKRIKSIQKNIVKETTSLAGSTTESLRNIELVKSLGLTDQEIQRLNKNTYKILGLELRKVKSIRMLSFIQGTFVNFLRQVIMFTLLFLVFNNKLQPGEVLTLTFYSFFIFGPLQEIGNIIIAYREAEASLQNFHNLMQKQPEPQPAAPQHLGAIEKLEYRNVFFKHNTAAQHALQGISFTAGKGETIAFVGPSGSGKSTLVKLLVGLYRPEQGHILYNNVEGDQIDFDELRTQIGFVTQDTQLFAGSIKENLQFVSPSASDEDMLKALQQSASHSILAKADNGIHSIIGEGGIKISGGEKQRLSIARALLRKPQLLIFDEATSALDSITEEEITNTIKDISSTGNQITILIAHRLSTIMHADRIFVLEQGEIVETGSHEELLNEKGLYYAMWRQQIGERKKQSTLASS